MTTSYQSEPMCRWTSEQNLYRIYTAVKLHFNFEKYNYLDTKGMLKNVDKIVQRGDVKLTRTLTDFAPTPREFLRLCVSNFLYLNDSFLYDDDEKCDTIWRGFEAYCKSKEYYLRRDLSLLEEKIYRHGKEKYIQEVLINDLFSGTIKYETMVYVAQVDQSFLNVKGYFADKVIFRIKKAFAFLPIDEKIDRLVKELL